VTTPNATATTPARSVMLRPSDYGVSDRRQSPTLSCAWSERHSAGKKRLADWPPGLAWNAGCGKTMMNLVDGNSFIVGRSKTAIAAVMHGNERFVRTCQNTVSQTSRAPYSSSLLLSVDPR